MQRSVSPAGDCGLLLEFDSIDAEALSQIAEACRERAGVGATIVGQQSILVVRDTDADPDELQRFLQSVEIETSAIRVARTVDIEVNFEHENAPDLPRLLDAASITRDDFLRTIASLGLRARFLGFRPGFAYLEGLPASWQLPRFDTPRQRVPAGSLGITGAMAGFYAGESPGGWNLIGRTDAALWDPYRDPPNLISAGDRVRIVPTSRPLRFEKPQQRDAEGEPVARVVRPGQLTLFTGASDLSRYRSGLAPSGAFDVDLKYRVNVAAGNEADAVVLECTLVGPALEVVAKEARFAFAGDAEVKINGREAAGQFEAKRGDRIEVGPIRDGIRGYLAVEGGWSDPAPRFAASPARIARDETLRRGTSDGSASAITNTARDSRHQIRAIAGPHEVDRTMLAVIENNAWTVTPVLDRVGIRLRAGIDVPSLPSTLPSLGMQFGTVQWHPSGELVAMGPDHPITGGYLQPMTIVSNDLWKLAQLRPGEKVSFEVLSASNCGDRTS